MLFTVGAIPIIFASFFVFSNFRANTLDKKAKFLVKPYYVRSELVYYYQDKLELISKAIQLSKGNAEYYADKADYLQKAVKDDVAKELIIYKKDIEELYKKAIELNPANFLYHFQLGWFYTNEERFEEAEKELIKSRELYSINPKLQYYLAKYYLKRSKKAPMEKEDLETFKLLLRVLELAWGKRWEFLGEIKERIKDSSHISWDNKKQQLIYTADLGSSKYDFKEQGFPHGKIPILIRIYSKIPPQEVVLYRKYTRFDTFERIEDVAGLTIYEVKVMSFPEDAYLDDLRIETYPAAIIDKIEIVKSFR